MPSLLVFGEKIWYITTGFAYFFANSKIKAKNERKERAFELNKVYFIKIESFQIGLLNFIILGQFTRSPINLMEFSWTSRLSWTTI